MGGLSVAYVRRLFKRRTSVLLAGTVASVLLLVLFGLTTSFFVLQAEDGIRDLYVTGVQTCALPILVYGGDLAVSIPSNVVSSWIAGLSRRRQISLGIEVETVDLPATLREKVGVSSKRGSMTQGLLVVALEAGNLEEQSDRTGLLIGDLLLDAAGKPIDDAASLLDIVARKDRQDSLQMRLVRGGSLLTLDVSVAALERRE